MKHEIYQDITAAHDLHEFEFVSVGRKGDIPKRVLLIPSEKPGVYDLELGDMGADGSINYSIVSDNGDRNKILATIMRIIEIYTGKYPERIIRFVGNTVERVRLYRMSLGANLDELSVTFDIYAQVDGELISFTKNMNAAAFFIKRKKGNFSL